VSTVGTHCILELYGCSPEVLNDAGTLLAAMRHAAESAGATWLDQVAHRFHPQGVTALGLLAESHVSVHTWPELGYAAADVFTCGEHTDPKLACTLIAEALRAGETEMSVVPRATRFTTLGQSPGAIERTAHNDAVTA